jgi:hypothetical protein
MIGNTIMDVHLAAFENRNAAGQVWPVDNWLLHTCIGASLSFLAADRKVVCSRVGGSGCLQWRPKKRASEHYAILRLAIPAVRAYA